MGRRSIYGKTWWGKAWIKALEEIDRDVNRLPRGRTYANKGRVLDIKLKNDGKVYSWVQGSRRTPYNVRIALKPFTKVQKAVIRDILMNRPDLSSQMLVGNLPTELFEILLQRGIALFPGSWEDMESNCSCPDWANPCKHLAAVYYILANEIDKDPFLILQLHGLSKGEIISFAEETGKKKDVEHAFIDPDEKEEVAEETRGILNLNVEDYNVQKIISLLPEKPLFYPEGAFKPFLSEMYKQLSSYVQKDTGELKRPYFKETDFNLFISEKEIYFEITGNPIDLPVKSRRKRDRKFKASIADLIDYFNSLSLETDENDSETSLFLKKLFSFIFKITQIGAFVPITSKLDDNNSFSIIYIPVLFNEKLKAYVKYLKSISPHGFVKKFNGKILKKEFCVKYVTSVILTNMVMHTFVCNDDNRILRTFFKGSRYVARKFDEKQTFISVNNWLEPLMLRNNKYSVSMRIEPKSKTKYKLFLDIHNKRNPLEPPMLLEEFRNSAKHGRYVEGVLKQLGIISRYSSEIGKAVASKNNSVIIDSLQLSNIIVETLPILEILGVDIVMPKEMKKLLKPSLRLLAKSASSGKTVSYLNLRDMISFDWKVYLGEKALNKEEIGRLLKFSRGIVNFNNNYVMVEPEELRSMLARMQETPQLRSDMELMRGIFGGKIDGFKLSVDGSVEEILNELRKVKRVGIPRNLNAELRHYQTRGYRWIYNYAEKGFGTCLADDMGLGKTIQVISVILKRKEKNQLSKPVLVVCPTTLIGNWYKECERFAPDLVVRIYHGINRQLEGDYDILLTSYGIVRRDLKEIKERNWSVIVIDEAQNIKNPDTVQTRAIKSIKADSKIAMTGTPVENRLLELWSIYDFLMPGYLPNRTEFIKKYSIPIEKFNNSIAKEELRRIIQPFMMRRVKTDKKIIKDLPEKINFDEYVYLKPEQTMLYKELTESLQEKLSECDGIKRSGVIFKLITALKQICNHPVNYIKKGTARPELSGKSEKLMELINDIVEQNEKALVFTQYREMGKLLVKMLKNRMEFEPLFFHGGLSRKIRDEMVEKFQNLHQYPIMIISLKAGGTGLNLTAANHVIHYDLWWNPAVENQATDRVFRIGQMKNVIVHRFITVGTFEERIDEMLKKKRELADSIVGSGEKWITRLSNDEIINLLKLHEVDTK